METRDFLHFCFMVSFFLKSHRIVVEDNVVISVIASFRFPKKRKKKLTEV